MLTLLRRGDGGRLMWKSDRRRPSNYYAIFKHLEGFEARVPNMTAPFLLARVVKAQSSPKTPPVTSLSGSPTGDGLTSRARAITSRKTIRAIWPKRCEPSGADACDACATEAFDLMTEEVATRRRAGDKLERVLSGSQQWR
jgi:hypothetical protein